MTNPKTAQVNLDYQVFIDGLGQGILLFDSDDRLVLENAAVQSILGTNLALIRSEGWSACSMLLDARKLDGPTANEIRTQALNQKIPIRFHTLIAGAYTPCWAASIQGTQGAVYTMITLEQTDWRVFNELMSTFRDESQMAISSTQGHAELIIQMIRNAPPNMNVQELSKRVMGFAQLMVTQMYHLELLTNLLHRLEVIRTGELTKNVQKSRQKIKLADFLEEFLEALLDDPIIDSEKPEDIRERLKITVPSTLIISASLSHLTAILRDLLRNAVMYSPAGSPLTLNAFPTQQGTSVQIDITDQGYGIRAKESEKVFAPFQRARQPQIIAEFGYGLSLHLCKAEIEAMGGRIWYESEEGVGSTFSIKLPAWQDATSPKA